MPNYPVGNLPEPAPEVYFIFYFIFWLPGGGSAIIDLLIEIDFEIRAGETMHQVTWFNYPGSWARFLVVFVRGL